MTELSTNDTPIHAAHSRFRLIHALFILLAVVVGLSILIRSGWIRLSPDATAHRSVGQPLKLRDLTPIACVTDPVGLNDVTGKVTLLHFWGTWCGPCKLEYPELVELYHTTSGESDLCFVSVSCRGYPGQSLEDIKLQTCDYYESNGFEIPTYVDTDREMQEATAAALEQTGLMYPTTVIIDSNGIVRAVWLGYHRSGVSEMYQVLTDLLGDMGAA